MPQQPVLYKNIVVILHNEELHNLYYSLSIAMVIKSRRMRWTVHVAGMEEMKNACSLIRKSEGMILLWRSWRRRVEKILNLILKK
jgi:hypothetical protein